MTPQEIAELTRHYPHCEDLPWLRGVIGALLGERGGRHQQVEDLQKELLDMHARHAVQWSPR